MIPHRRQLLFLVTGLAVLIVTFAVLMGFQTLFAAVGDQGVARILFGFAVACLVMLVVDVLLLVGVLGLRAVGDEHRRGLDQGDAEETE